MTGIVTLDPTTRMFDLWLPAPAPPSGPGLLLSDLTSKSEIEEALDFYDYQINQGRGG
ncbi:MAG: hypothetical protein ACYC4U_11165 [Pirellulaceae bacterium]